MALRRTVSPACCPLPPAILVVLALFASTATASTLTRQQAVAALLAPGSGVAFVDTSSAIWSPFANFGFGAGFEGLLPAGSSVDPAHTGTEPYPGPGMPVAGPSYFFWIDDGVGSLFVHAVRFVLLDATAGSPTVANGGIQVTSQGWWPVITRPGSLVNTYFHTSEDRSTDLAAGFGNPQGLIAGPAWPATAPSITTRPEHPISPGSAQAGNGCALLVKGDDDHGSKPDKDMFEGDMNAFAGAMVGKAGVAPGRIFKANGGNVAGLGDLHNSITNMCAANPPCDKIYVLITTHGGKGELLMGGVMVSAAQLCDEMKRLAAKGVPVCMLISACYSGSLIDSTGWGLPDGSVIITAADADHKGYGGNFGDMLENNEKYGTLFLRGMLECWNDPNADQILPLDGRVSFEEAALWVLNQRPCYIRHHPHVEPKVAFYPAGPPLVDPQPPNSNPGPRIIDVWTPTDGGGRRIHGIAPATPAVSYSFAGDPNQGTTDAVSLYQNTGGSGWVLARQWNWNAGLTRTIAPDPAGGSYCVVAHGNNYPIQATIFNRNDAQPESYSSMPTLPSFSVGWADQSAGEFNPFLGQGGGSPNAINVLPGLPLNNVPAQIGANYWQYLDVGYQLQPDFSRPWLYVNNNPAQGFAGPTYAILGLENITDPAGQPVASLPLEIDFFQGAMHPYFVQAVRQANGTISVPTLNLGPLQVQPFFFRIKVAGAPLNSPNGAGAPATPAGRITLDAFTVATASPGTAGVPPLPAPEPTFQLTAPRPNPFATSVRFELVLTRGDRVLARILDAAGREVSTLKDGRFEPGVYGLAWNGLDHTSAGAASGVYFAKVQVGSESITRRVVLIR